MLKKILKWTGTVLGSFVIQLIIFYGFIYGKSEVAINKAYEVKSQSVT